MKKNILALAAAVLVLSLNVMPVQADSTTTETTDFNTPATDAGETTELTPEEIAALLAQLQLQQNQTPVAAFGYNQNANATGRVRFNVNGVQAGDQVEVAAVDANGETTIVDAEVPLDGTVEVAAEDVANAEEVVIAETETPLAAEEVSAETSSSNTGLIVGVVVAVLAVAGVAVVFTQKKKTNQ